ncbi:hypothetical protein PIB30_113917, partial [Stylosanthes scabra]|nr:hypothetical protein [Stylosanthes scabra]
LQQIPHRSRSSSEDLELAANLLWLIWKARNVFIFEGVRQSPSQVVAAARALVDDMKRGPCLPNP